jgi:hypothetical protein
MSHDAELVLRAAFTLGNGEPRVVEYRTLASATTLAEGVVKVVAAQLQQQRLCMATFGGLQLTAAGIQAAGGIQTAG